MSDTNLQKRLCPVEGLAWRTIDNDVYIFKMEGSLHVLEGSVAQLLWQEIDGGEASPESLLKSVTTRFKVSDEEAGLDLQEFLGNLSDAGLLVN